MMMLLAAAVAVAPLSASAQPRSRSGDDGASWHTSAEKRGRLGAQVMSINDALRLKFGAPRGAGILVSEVEEGSPAAGAGLEVGDVIVSVDGQKIAEATDVARALAGKKKGDVVPVVVLRNHISTQLKATLDADAPERYEAWDGPGDASRRRSPRMLRRFPLPSPGPRAAPPQPPGGDTVVPDEDLDEWMRPFDDMARRMRRGMYDEGTAKAILERLEKIERRLDAMEKEQR